jgi:hypothetical protein
MFATYAKTSGKRAEGYQDMIRGLNKRFELDEHLILPWCIKSGNYLCDWKFAKSVGFRDERMTNLIWMIEMIHLNRDSAEGPVL